MVFYGEIKCNGIIKISNKPCNNYAYYNDNDRYLCGVHSKKETRKLLLKNPNEKERKLEIMNKHEESYEIHKNVNGKGKIIVKKMLMMKNPELIEGFMNVFPNFKHINRKDGFCCSELSPKSLGPVEHNMPNLPIAKNIENYHQFAKFWNFEFDKNNKVKKEYFEKRKNAYNNSTPFRHKYDREILKKYGTNINIPKCSIYYDKYENEHRYNYLQCRYFYCHFYELLAKKEEKFKHLKEKYNNGYNLCIIGYDGYEPKENLMEMYLDISKPFGHEMVLYSLLIENDVEKYPWNIYYNENYEIYKDVI